VFERNLPQRARDGNLDPKPDANPSRVRQRPAFDIEVGAVDERPPLSSAGAGSSSAFFWHANSARCLSTILDIVRLWRALTRA
jgi:hypothetical protein